MAWVWRSEDSFQESVLSFYRVGLGGQTHVIRLDSKHLERTEGLLSDRMGPQPKAFAPHRYPPPIHPR